MRTRQYTYAAEARRARLARNLSSEYGFTWQELVKLTGMKLRDLPSGGEEHRAAAYMEGCVQ